MVDGKGGDFEGARECRDVFEGKERPIQSKGKGEAKRLRLKD